MTRVDIQRIDDATCRVSHGRATFTGTREKCVEWLLKRAQSIEIFQVLELRKAAGRIYKT